VTSNQTIKWVLKPAVFLAALGPAGWLVWAAVTGHLSANPLSDITNETGVWTLRFLCITLAVTPLRRLTGWNGAIRFRRMVGLFAFFYGTLHFLTYAIIDRFAGLDFPDGIVAWSTVRNLGASVAADVYKRPFITVGFTALISAKVRRARAFSRSTVSTWWATSRTPLCDSPTIRCVLATASWHYGNGRLLSAR